MRKSDLWHHFLQVWLSPDDMSGCGESVCADWLVQASGSGCESRQGFDACITVWIKQIEELDKRRA